MSIGKNLKEFCKRDYWVGKTCHYTGMLEKTNYKDGDTEGWYDISVETIKM